jgi:hypothetical protein
MVSGKKIGGKLLKDYSRLPNVDSGTNFAQLKN